MRKLSPLLFVMIIYLFSSMPSSAFALGKPSGEPGKAKRTHPRVIFNCDGSSVYHDSKGTGEERLNNWIQNLYGPLENSHVETLFWCDGTGCNQARYDSDVLERSGTRLGKVDENLEGWIAAGNDPPLVVVREARKRDIAVWYSLRLNDIHDSIGDWKTKASLPTFKVENPDWMIGKLGENTTAYGYWSALKFDIPEVRDLKFAIIKELFQKYDFDGIEIDFMRGPPFFEPGTEPQKAHILTKWLKRVRDHLNAVAKKRGRPIGLAVRVDETLNACALDGFDVKTWIDDGLVDIIALGSGTIDIDVEDFKNLTKGTDVLVYPCLYGWPSKYSPITPEIARALAVNYWYQGADGIYLFNWFPHGPHSKMDTSHETALMKQIGDPKILKGKDKTYPADRGAPAREYPHNWMNLPLPTEIKDGEIKKVPILIGEDLSQKPLPAKIELQIHFENHKPTDKYTVLLNRKPVGQGQWSADTLVINLKSDQIIKGKNQILLTAINAQAKVTGMEIHVSY